MCDIYEINPYRERCRLSFLPLFLIFASLVLTTCLQCSDKSDNPPQQINYSLTVTIGTGAQGYPQAGSYIYNPGDTIRYEYQLLPDYSDLCVKIDDLLASTCDTFIMDSDHRIDVSCLVKIFWRYNTDQPVYYCTPAVADDGKIYVTTGIYLPGLGGWRPGAIYCLYPDGTLDWSYDVGVSLYSTAIGTDGKIYLLDKNYKAYAFTADGTLSWTYDDYEHPHSARDMGQRTPAIGADGTIYVGADGLYALDPADGSRQWYFGRSIYGSECISSPVIGSDNTIYVMIGQDTLYAINPDGTRKWAFGFEYDHELSFANPAIDNDGVIYLTSESYLVGSHVYAVNPNGTQKWRYQVPEDRIIRASPAIGADGTIYIGTKAGGADLSSLLIALSPAGNPLWQYVIEKLHSTPDDIYSSPTIGDDGIIYFGAETGYIYAINPNGTLSWKHDVNVGGGINWSSPVIIGDGSLLIGGIAGGLGYTGAVQSVACSSYGYASSPWPKFRHDNRNSGRFGQ